MPGANHWRFEQLRGDRRILILEGTAAPFGGPRKEAVVEVGYEVRQSTTHYPGGENLTRHVFGGRWAPEWELKGRFQDDRLGGAGQARLKYEEVEAFVRDQQLVRIYWGDVFVYEGFILSVRGKYENEAQIAWTLSIAVDRKDADATKLPEPTPLPRPADLTAAIVRAFSNVEDAVDRAPFPILSVPLLSTLGDALMQAVRLLDAVTAPIEMFRTATAGELHRMLSAVERLRSAAVPFRELVASFREDALALRQRAEAVFALGEAQANVELDIRKMLAAAAELERCAQARRVDFIKALYTAQTGDTWESISVAFYRTPSRANELREANAAPPGQSPVPGETCVIVK
jgi:hypothetical protein